MTFFGLFSRIFALIYLTSTPKMVFDMFKTVITFPSVVNMQTSFHFQRWGKTPNFFQKLKIDF